MEIFAEIFRRQGTPQKLQGSLIFQLNGRSGSAQ